MIDPIMLALCRKSKGIPRVMIINEAVPMDGTEMTITDPETVDVLGKTHGILEVVFYLVGEDGRGQLISSLFTYITYDSTHMFQLSFGPLLFTIMRTSTSPWTFSGRVNTA